MLGVLAKEKSIEMNLLNRELATRLQTWCITTSQAKACMLFSLHTRAQTNVITIEKQFDILISKNQALQVL